MKLFFISIAAFFSGIFFIHHPGHPVPVKAGHYWLTPTPTQPCLQVGDEDVQVTCPPVTPTDTPSITPTEEPEKSNAHANVRAKVEVNTPHPWWQLF